MTKLTLVTGASGGIGEALAHEFARHGHDLILVSRTQDKLDALASLLSSNHRVSVTALAMDLSLPGAVEALMAELGSGVTSVEYLVNNAGVGDFGLFADSDLSRQRQMMSLNMMALTELTHCVLPHMVKRGDGRILNLASTAAFLPGPFMSVYYASKAYVLSFSQAIANELSENGVTVTALCPGPTASEFQTRANVVQTKARQRVTLPASSEVARYGYRAMMAGKRVAVPGLLNTVMTFLVRLLPRNTATGIIRKVNDPAG